MVLMFLKESGAYCARQADGKRQPRNIFGRCGSDYSGNGEARLDGRRAVA
jgi:hypothetical protein